MSKRNVAAALIAAVASFSAVDASEATPVNFYTSARVQVENFSNPAIDADFQLTLNGSQASTDGSLDPTGADVASASSAADLATSQLKGLAAVTSTSNDAVLARSVSIMGDGFRAIEPGGSPFSYRDGPSMFSFTVSRLPDDGDFDFSTSFLSLYIYDPGTLDSSLPNNATRRSLTVWRLADSSPSTPILDSGVPVVPIPVVFVNDVAQIFHFVDDGSAFDWALVLQISGGLSAPGSFIQDYTHTVVVEYLGVAGSTTMSSSGFVPAAAVAPVPEPGTMTLMGLGLLSAARARRRKH